MKILVIGDIHGRDNWKTSGDISTIWETPNLSTEYDKYVFLGDYVDSWDISNVLIKHNLKEVIQFKKNYPDNVILLWGNHDMQYLFDYIKHGCSGFRGEDSFDLSKIFNDNKKLFQLSYLYENYLFTHAGVDEGWYEYSAKSQIFELGLGNEPIDVQLNSLFDNYKSSIFDVDYVRGGCKDVGGPLWADKSKSQKYPLENYHQIVGHSIVDKIKTFYLNNDETSNTSITYCDTENKEDYILEI